MFDQGRDQTVGVTSRELQVPQGTEQLRQIQIIASLEQITFFVCWSVWTGMLRFRKHSDLSTFYKWIERNREGTHLHPRPISKYKHVLDKSRVSQPTILLSLPVSRGHCLQQEVWVNHGYGNGPCSLGFIYVKSHAGSMHEKVETPPHKQHHPDNSGTDFSSRSQLATLWHFFLPITQVLS